MNWNSDAKKIFVPTDLYTNYIQIYECVYIIETYLLYNLAL